MHGVASPSLGPIRQSIRHPMKELDLNSNGTHYPRLHQSPRPHLRNDLQPYDSHLGDVTLSTYCINTQILNSCNAGEVDKELNKFASEGHEGAAAWLDIFDALNTMQATNSGTCSVLSYLENDLLPLVWGSKETESCFFKIRVLVITRIALIHVNILFRTLIKLLNEISDCQSFWRELEHRPFRIRLILSFREYTKYKDWVSLRDTIKFLEDFSVKYFEHLGRLKELLLLFEDIYTVGDTVDVALSCFQHVEYILNLGQRTPDANHMLLNEKTIKRTSLIFQALEIFKIQFRSILNCYTPIPRYIKYWPEISLATIGVLGLVGIMSVKEKETWSFFQRISDSWLGFFSQHVTRPLAALVDEIVFDHTLIVADIDAMNDAKESLGRMLKEYIQDMHPNVDQATLADIENSLDVSILSRQYEAELKKPITSLVSGDLVRMLLIQMQFMKKELLVVMTALDELIRENQFNLEVMATVPAVLLVYSVYHLGKYSINAIRGNKRAKWYIFREVRFMLRDTEQLLNWNSKDNQALRGISLGRLVHLLNQLESTLLLNADQFCRSERARLGEDVAELLSDHLSIVQKMNTIHRMHRTYTFLQPSTNMRALFF